MAEQHPESFARNFSAFYMDPPVFIDEDPVHRATADVDFSSFDKEVLRVTLDCGIGFKVTVEGLFAFDFSSYPPAVSTGPVGQDNIQPFDEVAEVQIRRTYIMNAYLAFFYTRQLAEHRLMPERMIVTPELIIGLSSFDLTAGQSFGNQRSGHLAMSRFQSTYATGLPHQFDNRISMRGQPIRSEVARAAAQDLSSLIVEHKDNGVQLVDLFMRATKAYQDHNHSLSLINSWAIIERLINVIWQTLQQDYKEKDGQIFIDRNRKARLNDGRTFTAAVMSEMLSFLDYLPNETYQDMNVVRKARNDWMHSLKQVPASTAELSMKVCERLLLQTMNVNLASDTGRRVHS